MDDVWVRLALVAGALALASAVVVVLRMRRHRSRRLAATGLAPGVYLFTSSGCPDCRVVRDILTDMFGETGFTVKNWEEEPAPFDALSIDAVPATLVVAGDGSGTLIPGRPHASVLERLSDDS